MKGSLLGNLTFVVFAALVMLCAPRAALAQTAFNVTVPNRISPYLPVAQVKVWLTVNSPSTTLDSLTVTHGTDTLTFPPSPTFSRHVPAGSRNLVKFTVIPAENRVEIILYLEGNLLEVGGTTKYCRYSTSPSPSFAPWQFSYTNASGNSATSYRFNSYEAAAGSGMGCDCNNRRIGDAAVHPEITFTSPALPSTAGQRFPIDLVFVLDRSGSMNETIPMSMPAVVKMDKLHSAMGTLIDTWDMAGGPNEDRLAVIWFSTTTEIENPPGGFAKRVPAAPPTWGNIRDLVTVKPASGWTAMGDGITQAFNIHQLIPEAERSDLFIILLTDGVQNQGRLILPGNNPDVTAANTAVGAPALTQAAKAFWDETVPTDQYVYLAGKCTPVQAVGIGPPAGSSFAATLHDMADETGGTVDINLGTTMDMVLLNAIISSLKGNTLTKVTEVATTLAASSPSAAPAEFALSGAVSRAVVVLSWDAPPSGLELQINRPDNTTFNVPAGQRRDNPRYTVQAIDLPANGPPGRWTATVRRAGGNTVATPYHLSVVAVEDRLSFSVDFASFSPGTGDPIILRASIADRGVAVTGLGNSINVRVKRPATALGTLLRNTAVSQSVLTTDPAGANPDTTRNSPYARKLFNLMQDPAFLALVGEKSDSRTFTLFDDGNPNNGDAVAGDGVYSMKFSSDDTRTPGAYKFDVSMDFDRPPLGRIVRTEKREVEVRVKVADPTETEVAATKGAAAGEFRVDVTPADRFKNFMGPGFGDRIQLTLSGGGSVAGPPVDERENGTYTFRVVGVPAGADPTATLLVNGQPVKSAKLSAFSKPTKKFAFFGGIGASFPHGSFNTFFNSGVSTQLGFEYRFTNRVSAEGTFGFDRFGITPAGNQNLFRLSGNVKFYPVIGTYQLGVFGGGGVYHFDSGGGTYGGLNFGAVGEYRINTSVSIEGTYNFHNVFTTGSSTRFSTVQGGVRFRF